MMQAVSSLDHKTLDSILGGLGDGLLITDSAGILTYMNKAAEEIFEYTFSAKEKVAFSDVCKLVNVETGEKFFSPVARAMKEKCTVGLSRNIGIERSDGVAYLSATCSPMWSEAGEVIGCTSIFRNVSKMRRLERKVENDQFFIRSVFEAAKIGICSLDTNGRLVEANEAALEIWNSTYDEAIGQAMGNILQCVNSKPDGCGKKEQCKFCVIRNNIEAAIADDSFSSEFVAAVISSLAEEPIWLQFFITQVWKDEEKQIVLTLIDISKRKQKEKELQEARRRAEVANITKTRFLANMSHEIRTPINGMTGMINLTLKEPLSDEQKENLNAAKQCSEDLLQIINDILDYAKLENGKMAIEQINMDLHEMLQRVSILHRQQAEGKGLKFKEPVYEDLPKYIKGDPLRLRQILHNLLTNAVKFTLKGDISLGVRVFRRGTKELLEFFVEDTGIGMPPEARDKLFKPFSQVDGSTTRMFGGTGLGLMIVKELVTAMDGDVNVVSREGVGSCFSFTVPLYIADYAEEERKDQRVFINPYMSKGKDNKDKLENASTGEENKTDDSKDDIMELLKYCNDKLKE